jgi:hypothetical protein
LPLKQSANVVPVLPLQVTLVVVIGLPPPVGMMVKLSLEKLVDEIGVVAEGRDPLVLLEVPPEHEPKHKPMDNKLISFMFTIGIDVVV